MEPRELLAMTPTELADFFASLGEPTYRAAQVFPLLHRGVSPSDMTNLPKALREKLTACATWYLPEVRRKLVSAIDGTVKYLFALSDGNCVERRPFLRASSVSPTRKTMLSLPPTRTAPATRFAR